VLVPPGAPTAFAVHAIARWRAEGAPATAFAAQMLDLRRDVLPGESVATAVRIAAPAAPGAYELEIGLVQEDGARFDAPGTVVVHGRIAVASPSQGRPPPAPTS
jgi:hypothetical protein